MICLATITFILAWRGIICAPLDANRRQLGPLDIPWETDPDDDSVDPTPASATALAADALPIGIEPASSLAVPPISEVIDTLTSDVDAIVTQTTILTASTPSSEAIFTPSLTIILFPEETIPITTLVFSDSFPTTSSTESSPAATTTDTIYEPPVTITVSDPPTTTITDIITETASPSPTAWAAPAHFTNLDSFSITNFADGRNNLQTVDTLPANATSSNSSSGTNDTSADRETDSLLPLNLDTSNSTNSSTVLQLFYPANSTTPTHMPIGGADFYASPISLADATNVTFEYSVFFSTSFDWVKGGKLPGLYGGHSGCSGGNNATTCFSTRMMWRTGGAGELYLYAPKNKQTASLCSTPPKSVCTDPEYGLSIGRGSFYFQAGQWTHIAQTVILNTPGKQDGGFQLFVNGTMIMNHSDVYYRDAPPPSTSDSQPSPTTGGGPLSSIIGGLLPSGGLLPFGAHATGSSPSQSQPSPTDSSDNKGPLSPIIGGLLPSLSSAGGLLDSLRYRRSLENEDDSFLVSYFDEVSNTTVIALLNSTVSGSDNISLTPAQSSSMPEGYDSNTPPSPGAPQLSPASFDSQSHDDQSKAVGFLGLFFSTFFGGSTPDYATPTDQNAWFRDFALTINA